MNRDELGRVVRNAWTEWAKTQPGPVKPSWLVPYDELSEADKEADRLIGIAVVRAVVGRLNHRRLELIEKKNREGLSDMEAAEFATRQAVVFEIISWIHPPPPSIGAKLDEIEARLKGEGVAP